jgi:hypothetical protein
MHGPCQTADSVPKSSTVKPDFERPWNSSLESLPLRFGMPHVRFGTQGPFARPTQRQTA